MLTGVGWRVGITFAWVMVCAFGCDDEATGEDPGTSASSGSAGKAGAGGSAQGGAVGGGKAGASGKAGSSAPSGGDANEGGSPGAAGDSGSVPGGAGSSGSVAGSGSGGDGQAGGGSDSSPSSGCEKPSPSWKAAYRQIDVGGVTRRYFFVPPKDYSPNKAYPIIFGFHGGGSNGEQARDYFELETATSGQALLVYPSGNQNDGGWALGNQGADMQLFDAILKQVGDAYCVDQSAVFAMGFSYGGWMATQVACARPDRVRGIASIAGGGPMGKCNGAVAAMLIHGSNDQAEPIAAGESSRNQFRQLNGCNNASSAVDPSPCVGYQGCEAPLVWCAHTGEHYIPDFGRAAMWSFFQSLR